MLSRCLAVCPTCRQPVFRAVSELRGDDAEAAAAVDVSAAASARRQSVVPYQSPDYFRLLAFAFEAEQRSRAERQRLRHGPSSRRQRHGDERQRQTEEEGAEEEEEEEEEAASDAGLLDSPLPAVFSPSRLHRRAPALLPASPTPQEQTTETEIEAEGSSDRARAAAAAASLCPPTPPRPASSSSSSSSSPSSAGGGLHSSSFITGYYDRFFRKGRKLGGGSFGVVFFTSHVLEGVELGQYACKIIPVGDSKQWLLKVSAEIRALEAVHHRNVVSYRHSWLEEARVADYGPSVPCLFVLMEYCNQGTVAELVWPKRRTAQQQRQTGRESAADGRHAAAADAASAAQSEDEGRAAAGRVKQARRRRRQRQAEHRLSADTAALLAPQPSPSSPTASPQRSPPSASSSSSRRRRCSASPEARVAGSEAAAADCASGDGSVVFLLEADIWWLFLDCCLGLRHLHRCGVVHNDLKLENLLLTADVDARGQRQGRRALISDMGNAIIKGEQHLRTGMTGTLQYAAPETLRPQEAGEERPQQQPTGGGSSSSPYSEASDLWSLGVMLFALCYSRLPFSSPGGEGDSASSMYAAIVSRPVQLPSHPRRSGELKALITRLLSLDPQHRPDCEQILSHPAIQRRREERRRREAAAAAATSSLSPYSSSAESEGRGPSSPAAAPSQSGSEQPGRAAAAVAAAASPVGTLLPAASPTSSPLPAVFPPRLLLPSPAALSETDTAIVPVLPVPPAAAPFACSSGLCFGTECAVYLCLLLLHQAWTVARLQRLAVSRTAAAASSPAQLLWTLGRALSPAVLLSAASVYGAALSFQLRSQQTAEAARGHWRLSFHRSLAVRLSLALCLHLLLYALELH